MSTRSWFWVLGTLSIAAASHTGRAALVAHWPMDEGKAAEARDASGRSRRT